MSVTETAARDPVVRAPAVFVTHGGGPMPLMGQQVEIARDLRKLAAKLPHKPRAIVAISGHWEEDQVTILASEAPPMLYDYGGFPPEAYKITYKAPGDPALARRIEEMLRSAGLQVREETKRGYDHGVFVPLKLVFPDADIPIVCVSLLSSLDPQKHVELGEALSTLRDNNILVFGSGSSFHNMSAFRSASGCADGDASASVAKSKEFDDYITDAVTNDAYSPEERKQRIVQWRNAPHAAFCHPREEHLLPLHVVVGAAHGERGTQISNTEMAGFKVSSYMF